MVGTIRGQLFAHCIDWGFVSKSACYEGCDAVVNSSPGSKGLVAGQSTFGASSPGSVLRSRSISCYRGLIISALYYHFQNELAICVLCSGRHLKSALGVVKTAEPMCDELFKVRQQWVVACHELYG